MTKRKCIRVSFNIPGDDISICIAGKNEQRNSMGLHIVNLSQLYGAVSDSSAKGFNRIIIHNPRIKSKTIRKIIKRDWFAKIY